MQLPFLPHRGRLRLAILGVILGAIASVLTCGSCVVLRVPDTTQGSVWRTPAQQVNADVDIGVTCGDGTQHTGTGVVVSPTQVVTALHVASCPDHGTPLIMVSLDDNAWRMMVVEVQLPGIDVARLSMWSPYFARNTSPVVIGPRPVTGDRLCEAAAEPRWTYRCFIAQPPMVYDDGLGSDIPATGRKILVDGTIEHGNSGSGVYDARGRLVGILVTAGPCEEYMCEGGVAPLQGEPWLIPAR